MTRRAARLLRTTFSLVYGYAIADLIDRLDWPWWADTLVVLGGLSIYLTVSLAVCLGGELFHAPELADWRAHTGPRVFYIAAGGVTFTLMNLIEVFR
jgi:uncharacterized membrane protein